MTYTYLQSSDTLVFGDDTNNTFQFTGIPWVVQSEGTHALYPGLLTYTYATGGSSVPFATAALQDTRTVNTYFHQYAAFNIQTLGGNDVIYLQNITGRSPYDSSLVTPQIIHAGAGDDFVFVSAVTNANVYGGTGRDTIIVDNVRTVNIAESGANSAEQQGDTYFNERFDPGWTEMNYIDGGDGDDIIAAGAAHDWILGGAGNDWITPGAGTSYVFGGSGDDTVIIQPKTDEYNGAALYVWGGTGRDIISVYEVAPTEAIINGGAGNDWITYDARYGTSPWLVGGEGDDFMVATDHWATVDWRVPTMRQRPDTLWGGKGNDTLVSPNGEDVLVGGEGHDWLLPGENANLIYMGPGGGVDDAQSDVLVVDDPGYYDGLHRRFGTDTLFDFQPASRYVSATGQSDKIDISAMMAENRDLTYSADNPFVSGDVRLVSDGASNEHTILQFKNASSSWQFGDWVDAVYFSGVAMHEFDTSQQGSTQFGFEYATGGDFIWWVG